MKIGIITFHASLNCGSMLQAYALQEVLSQKYGADVEIINYSNLGQRSYYANWDLFPKPSIQINNLKALPYYSTINAMRNDYRKFAEKYFNLSGSLIKKYSGLKNIDKKYDIIITGGDQVWNVRCRDADKAYFLSFVKNAKKVSYSPSLGARNINKVSLRPKMYSKLIKDFDAISVREDNGQKWIKELTGIEVPIIADPTILLTKQQWEKRLNIEDVKEKFILFYAFSYANKHNNEILSQVSKKYNLPIYIIDNKQWNIYKLGRFGIRLWKQSGPEAFLSLVNSAQFVLVQSFHGIIFSSIFHKTFWSLRNAIVKNPDDDRAKVILRQTGLEKRAICFDELMNIDLEAPIDFTDIDKRMGEMREKAFDYINSFYCYKRGIKNV